MKIYLKNKITSEIIIIEADSFNILSKKIRDLYEEATQLEIDNFNLKEAKKIKKKEILENRKEFIYSPVLYNGSTFINTEIAGNNLQAAASFLTEPINWLDIEGNTVVLTMLQIKELIMVMINKRSQGYFREAELSASVDGCTTIQEVEQLDISF